MLDNIKMIKLQNQKFRVAGKTNKIPYVILLNLLEKEDRLQKENHILLGHIVSINVKGKTLIA